MSLSRHVVLILPLLLSWLLLTVQGASGQHDDHIWGRIRTVSGEVHEGFIRWDRNEGVWADLLNGSKETPRLVYDDWWVLAHPGDRSRDRVIEVAGYRITWDDDEPAFSSSHESGVRFGHVRSLTPLGDDEARIELRSGRVVALEGGATDLGTELREILVFEEGGRRVSLEWEELERVDFEAPPPGAPAPGRRLHGTVRVREGPEFTGYLSWDSDEAFTTDTLEGLGSRFRRGEIRFGRIAALEKGEDAVRLTLDDGSEEELRERVDLDWGRPRIQISDPALGMVEVTWEEVEEIRFHPPETPAALEGFDGGRPLRGTVLTADSTELAGWIRWDADEAYTWEILDGREGPVTFDIELGMVAAMERSREASVTVSVGVTGADVDTDRREGLRVSLRDGRVFTLDGSNDVDENNEGIFVLEEGTGQDPEDPEARWIMIRWRDFLAVRFEG
jgi:hypothetical protein